MEEFQIILHLNLFVSTIWALALSDHSESKQDKGITLSCTFFKGKLDFRLVYSKGKLEDRRH